MEETADKRKRYLFTAIKVSLFIFCAWAVIASPNPVGTFATFVIIWLISIFIIKRRNAIFEWSNSEKPLKQYLQENSEKRKEEAESIENATKNKILEKLVYGEPLNDTEQDNWNKIISSLDDGKK